jgi:DNA polymerase III delta prime subunit
MNRNKECILPTSTIYLVPKNLWSIDWKKQQQRFPYFPTAEDAIADLNSLSMQGEGVPASLHKHANNSEELRLYGSDYYLGFYSSPREDGYILSHIEPIDLRAHDTLADGVLLLRRACYQLCYRLPDIPHGSTNCKAHIWQEWEALEQDKQRWRLDNQAREIVTVAQRNYLNDVSSLIDVTYQLEQEKYKLSSTIPYVKFIPTGEQRSGLYDIYEFHLQKPVQIWQERYLLRITKAPDLCGRILSLSGTRLKLKFATGIDRKRIPEQGSFEIMPNDRIFNVQRQAVKMFLEGTARNRHLLHVLVNHRYQPHRPATHMEEGLNKEQQAAFQHALTVPDLLLVLGPPGTGKTHTITTIIRHHSTINKKRVLVTSRTHKAVDNVLSRLPPSLQVVRLGYEDRVSADTRHLLLDVKAKKMQEEILRITEQKANDLARFLDNAKEIMDWRRALIQCAEQMLLCEQRQQQVQERKHIALQRLLLPFNEELRTIEVQLQLYEQQLAVLDRKRERWQAAQTKQASRTHLFAIGWFFAWRWQNSQRHLLQVQSCYEEAQALYQAMKQANTSLQEQIQRALWADAEYRMLEDAQQEVEQSLSNVSRHVSRIIGLLHGTVERLLPIVSPPKLINAAMLRHYVAWYDQQYLLLTRWATLMRDWRAHVSVPSEQLRPEIIRYADVIGTTCIGVATAGGLDDMDFDLAVVDEAGQICLTDLLVPLARANRAVLVGDHQQLPPFVSNEMRDWLESRTLLPEEVEYGLDHQTIRSHLTCSAFELLFTEALKHYRLVRLTRQFRMPKVIADFASQHFYENQLYTAHAGKAARVEHDDPLFSSPLAVIDTTTLARAGHREEQKLKTEDWGGEGYTNSVEARIIAVLAGYYEQINAPWVIIVPYRAQAEYIIELFQHQFQVHTLSWEDRISTVDAFQGSECEKVIYGFTRSNPYGSVGFLAELRRLNVALTRAKEQLVVVGDFSTLMDAKDKRFRGLAQSLYQHAQQHGEVLSYEQCMQRLEDRKPKE